MYTIYLTPNGIYTDISIWGYYLSVQGKAGAVLSQVPLSVLSGACSVHSMAFSWPPPSPVVCALLGLHDLFGFLHLVLTGSVLSLAFIIFRVSMAGAWPSPS